MSDRRRFKTAYLTRKLAAAHALLADPAATDQARRGARCRLNRSVKILRALPAVPAMKRLLEVDRLADKKRALAA